MSNDSVWEEAKFKAQKAKNVCNDNMLKVSENTLIPKLLKASRRPRYRFYKILHN